MLPVLSHRRRPTRTGATVVEMAFTLPLFLMMGMAILEFGRGFMVQQLVTNASREGARHAVLPNTTNSDVVTKVRDYLTTGSINPQVVQVTVTPNDLQTANTGTQVRVHVRVQYSDVAWIPAGWFLRGASLTSETVMRHE